MQNKASPAEGHAVFLALKGLAYVAEIAMAAGVIYAAATAIRYWPHITV